MTRRYFLHRNALVCAVDGLLPDNTSEIIMNGIQYSDYCSDKDRYEIQDNILFDISNSTEYIEKKEKERKIKRIETIKETLAELDIKTIRAMREGGTFSEGGRSFLDVYQTQIDSLRVELQELEKETNYAK